MESRSVRTIRSGLLVAALSGAGFALPALSTARAEFETFQPVPDFQALHALIKRAPGESRWMEIGWYPSVWEGRQLAAREGKPLFLMAGSGGAPCAGC